MIQPGDKLTVTPCSPGTVGTCQGPAGPVLVFCTFQTDRDRRPIAVPS